MSWEGEWDPRKARGFERTGEDAPRVGFGYGFVSGPLARSISALFLLGGRTRTWRSHHQRAPPLVNAGETRDGSHGRIFLREKVRRRVVAHGLCWTFGVYVPVPRRDS